MNNTAVLIGEFQIPFVDGSVDKALNDLQCDFNEIIVFLLTVPAQPSRNRFLTMPARMSMLRDYFPSHTVIIPITMQENVTKMSEEIDRVLYAQFNRESNFAVLVSDLKNAVKLYRGKHEVLEMPGLYWLNPLPTTKFFSTPQYDRAFLNGMYWAQQVRYPACYSTVDIACHIEGKGWLFGQKPGADQLVFLGGFVDPEKDKTIEEAATRELLEEASGIEITGKATYLSSEIVNDWRYKESQDKIMTHLIKITVKENGKTLQGQDDIEKVTIISDEELKNVDFQWKVAPHHRNLVLVLLDSLRKSNDPNF